MLNTAGKKLAEHIIFATSTAEDSNPRAVALAARVRERYPQLPTFVAAAQSYDSVMLLAAAVKKAGSTDGEKLAATLENGVPDTHDAMQQLRSLAASATSIEAFRHGVDELLGAAWDADLEVYRHAGDGSPVTWLHQVV